jgi:membrane-associated protease RseP (regulator of RpoE activity)
MAMNRILLTGIAVLGLSNATVPADAAHKQARRYEQAPVQAQWFGSGARVEEVVPNTAAATAGIRPGDLITGIDGRPVSGYRDIDFFVASSNGRPLAIDIDRGGTHVRLRASPRLAILPTGHGSVQQRRVLGISRTEFGFGHGSDSATDPVIINPIIPDIPPPPPPTISP